MEEAHYNLANALARLGLHEAAIDHYTRVLMIDPSEHDARLGRGRALLALDRAEEALVDFVAIVETAPKNPAAGLLSAAALEHVDTGDPDASLAILVRVSQLREMPTDTRLALADAYGRLSRFADALHHYEQIPSGVQGRARAVLGQATTLFLLERKDEARVRLEAGLAEFPEDPRITEALAMVNAAPTSLDHAEAAPPQ